MARHNEGFGRKVNILGLKSKGRRAVQTMRESSFQINGARLFNSLPLSKNPAYGNQSISRAMQLVAQMPKNPIFLKNRKNYANCKTSKTSRNMPKLAIRPTTTGL